MTSLAEGLKIIKEIWKYCKEVQVQNKMSSLNVVREEYMESDGSGNLIRHSFSDDTQAKASKSRECARRWQKSLPYILIRSSLELLILLLLMSYFTFLHYLEKEDSVFSLLYINGIFESILIVMQILPGCINKGAHYWFDSLYVIYITLLLISWAVLDFYEASTDQDDHQEVFISIARLLRISLCISMWNSFKKTLKQKWKQSRKDKLELLLKTNSLESLLISILDKNESKDQFITLGITKAIRLAQSLKTKAKLRNKLNHISIESDKMEIAKTQSNEMKAKEEIQQKLMSITERPEDYFRDGYNFIFMNEHEDLKQILSIVEELEFDIFELEEKSNGNALFLISMHLMQKNKYANDFNINQNKMKNFAYTIQSSYNEVAYHNKTHAADVWQTFYYFMKTCDFIETAKLDNLEQACCLIAGLVHDIDHPGHNNVFLINTKDPLAVRYNDMAVLESYHVATAFNIMFSHEEWNIMESLWLKDLKKWRKLIINLVLATDMSRHFGGKIFLISW